MKKIWGAFFLITFLSDGNARVIEVSTVEEEASAGGASRTDYTREGRSELLISQEEMEEPVSVLSPGDASSAGGGLRLLDSKFLEPKDSLSSSEAFWWERWWSAVCSWFAGD